MEKAKMGAARLGDRRSRTFLSSLLAALLFSLLIGTGLLLLASLLLQRSADPSRLMTVVGVALAGAVAFLGGFRAGQLRRTSGALMGLCLGMLVVFLCLLAALILQGGSLPPLSLALYAGILLLATLGGTLATRRKPRRRSRR